MSAPDAFEPGEAPPARVPSAPQLRAMLAVIDAGTFGGAALTLGSTQSSVSQAIRQFEDLLGAKLFRRLPRGAEPTELCLSMEHDAREALTLLEGLPNFARPGAELTGTLRIASFRSIATHVLPPVLGALRAKHPNLRIELDGNCPLARDPELAVLGGRAHVAMGQLPMSPALFTAEVAVDDWVIVMPAATGDAPTDPWQRLKRLGRIQYTSDPIVPAVLRLLEGQGLNPVPFLQMSEDSSLLAAIARGAGYSVMPLLAVEPVPVGIELTALPERVHRRLGLGVPPRLMRTPMVRALVGALLNRDRGEAGGSMATYGPA